MLDGRMNRLGAKHVGEPAVLDEAGRSACMYAAAMVDKQLSFLEIDLEKYSVLFTPPATVVMSRNDDPDAVLTFTIPARVLAYNPDEAWEQEEF